MIILDTNVISEVMRPAPCQTVAKWMDATPAFDLATTAINIAEIRRGLARLPFGRRRVRLETLFDTMLVRAFENRVFGFDRPAADAYAELALARERSGRPFQGYDGLIAAIASSRGLGVATRDIRGFEGCGIQVVNPWEPTAT
jgi:predicted nucleic acid-binding protein